GPNGDTGRDVTGKVSTNKQLPVVDETTTSAPVAQVGTSPALTAVETGETPQVSAASVMEVRQSSVHFSALATSVENMLSRYAMIYEGDSNVYVSSDANTLHGVAFSVPLTFDSIQATAAVRAKFSMSTYLRFDLDVVMMVEIHNFGDSEINRGTYAQDAQPWTFQAIYLPPGMPEPPLQLAQIDRASPQWCYPTTPSIYWKNTDPPATFRVPFVGLGSAYVVAYDGYPNLDGQGTYGEYPGNTLGRICVRPCYKLAIQQSGSYRYNIKIFSRPVNVRSWMPRPIKTYKTQ
nr:VP1 [rabbit kobuvirus]